MESGSSILEDFGQKVDLTRRIREVLLNYPEGTTVLKELIQNADDAGATVVRLCLDRRCHPSDSLLSDSLATLQGPALLAYNDAVFTEEDFVSISRIGGSGKHTQSWKTGRFGVGFNSVYHLTDLPSFVSGKYVVLFDPQGAYLPNVSAANPGKRIDFVSSPAMSLYEDQFVPYCAFGCDMKSPFNGTLFRFPLRNPDQASLSRLSRQAYFEEDISLMFDQLFEEGVFSLLFLKCVLTIELYAWNAEDPEPTKLYACSVKSPSNDIVQHRQMLLRLSKTHTSNEGKTDVFSLDFVSESNIGSQPKTRRSRFYLAQTMASTSSRIGSFATKASKEFDIHLLPWASTAACISDDSSDEENMLKVGQAFCFLPLPVRTGLTIQVNGYFEISSNRRSIWYGDDMDKSGQVRAAWNRLLLEDVIAPTFTQLLLSLREILGPTGSYFSVWPCGSFEQPWSILVEQIYRNISDKPVLFSDLHGGKWVSPLEAFLHDEDFTRSKELGDVLLQLEMPLVHLPKTIFEMLLKYSPFFLQKVVTPDRVRHLLRESKSVSSLSKSCKLVLLEYCLEDLVDDDVHSHASNLPLLPLANGDFGFLCESSKGISYFICDELEYALLEKVHDRVIDRKVPPYIFSRLASIANSTKANLAKFTVQDLLVLFPRLVPVDWKNTSKVAWDPESSTHPSSTWFVLLWRYLQINCENLSLFCDWPILPSTSGNLYIASMQSKLIRVEKLTNIMRDILEKIGCKMLDHNFIAEHSDLSLYVSDANFEGVIGSIFDICSSRAALMHTFLNHLSPEEKDELRRFLLEPKWYTGCQIGDALLRNCRLLPIFQVFGGSGQETKFSDLVFPPKYLPPLGVDDCLLRAEFISCLSSREEEILSQYYGVARMAKSSFYKQNVLNKVGILEPPIRDKVMISILQNLPQLCVEDRFFRDDIKKIEFVPTISGGLKCPSALYDPRNEELCALLEDPSCFPSGVFGDPNVLDMLQGLGLRRIVSPETVVESARQVERLMHEDQERAFARGRVLLSYLEANAVKWLPHQQSKDERTITGMFSRTAAAFRPHNLGSNIEKFWNDLRMICWCPVLVSAPFQTLPWPVVTSVVAPPKLVRLRTDMWLVSASMRILDGECSSTALAYSLGWLLPPGGSAVAVQLLELGKNNEILIDQVLRKELALAMPNIYSILQSLIGTDEMDIVKAVLEGSRWIWVGDGFATSNEVVLDGPLHLAPYIRVIPTDLAVFKGLFLELGIREFLKPSDYIDILSRMASRKGALPLDKQEIRAALLIVQHLADIKLDDKTVVYLPDVSCCLISSSDLVFNDAPWLLASDDSTGIFHAESAMVMSARRTSHKFVHGNISNKVAEKLGVCSLRRLLLAESADSMNFSLSGGMEAFGQHEQLTTRLKHILEMYADGPGILFELVQNAEDAGASEVSFLLDNTQYGTSSLLSPEMADWQGPALYCFNDSVFTPQDLHAISSIGQESKLEKPFAIGKFGLGFNCVYHFTDIPAFISGENVVMFDPHASNLPGVSPSHPGLRIKFCGRKILDQFPDQFSPFLHFGCDLQHSFPGTLFRFPLRNSILASRSQIKKERYAPEDVLSLFKSFSGVVSDALIFLRNVKTISVFVKEGTSDKMQLLHHVRKENIVGPEMEINSSSQAFSLMNQFTGLNKDQFHTALRSAVDKDLCYSCQKMVVTQQSSSGCSSHGWITSEWLGSGLHENISKIAGNSHKMIPWASVAAYVNSAKENVGVNDDIVNSFDIFDMSSFPVQNRRNFEGRAFCFLPLPIHTGFPVHVNAYFELSSNRRDIWFGNDMTGSGKIRSDWNIYLLEEVVAPAYGHLLERIALEIGACELFFSFWPVSTDLEPWASVVRKLYKFIADSGLRVLYTKARGGRWISTKQAIFPDFNFGQADELVEILSDVGLSVVTISKSLVQRFMDTCPSLHFMTPKLLRTLLIRRKPEFKDRKGLMVTLEYCLLDLDVPFQADVLHGLPLLPLADGSATSFDKNGLSERIFIAECNEYELLRDSLPQQLVDGGIPEEVHKKLLVVAQSKASNVCLLSCSLLEKLFFKLLPADWYLVKKVVWTPNQQGHPSIEWIKVLWSYLDSCCDDLSIFAKWPILPVGDCCLMKLDETSGVIRNHDWTENMASLLLKCGCLFLSHELPIEHPQLEKYVQPPTAEGVLKAFISVASKTENIEDLFVNASEGELHELRSFILQSKWFIQGQMDDIHIEIIKHLPVFELYRSRRLVSLGRPAKWLKPDGIREEYLDDDFVRIESERERDILSRYVNIEKPTKVEFYKVYVLNRMSEFLYQPVALLEIFCDLKALVEEDVSIRSALSATPFVLAANGCWQQPSRLYDPRVPGLQRLLHKEVYFPSEKFSDPVILDALGCLGLKTHLDFDGYLDVARTVSILHDLGDSQAPDFGRRLLLLLDSLSLKLSAKAGDQNLDESQNPLHFQKTDVSEDSPEREDDLDENYHLSNPFPDEFEDEFWSELKSISWCPVYSDAPIQGFPWPTSSKLVASPDTVRPKSQMFMVSATFYLLDCGCRSSYLQHKLGWKDPLTCNVLARQLIELSKSFRQHKTHSSVDPDFVAMLQTEIPLLYSKMQEFIGTDNFMELKSALAGVAWVWIGDDFVSVDVLSFDSPIKFAPYLYVVPSELSEFKLMLLELGVRLSVDMMDYLSVLESLRSDVKGSSLSDDQISFALCILEAVADCFPTKSSLDPSYCGILVPDSAGYLMLIEDLVYNDAPWVENSAPLGKYLVHPRITNELAKKLGVKSLRCISLVSDDISKDLTCLDFSKLNELLALYGNKDFLFFDLLELADYCKIKTLHLILDKRDHSRKSLLQHNLGEFQGPALVAVLEGANLSREEVCGLHVPPPWRLRGDTLSFGSGILSCYYLCDILSVVSGGYFYMFDPQGLALSSSTPQAPAAKMFSLLGTDLLERFHDQFNPMLINQEMGWSPVDSTIIRMPLSSECLKDGLEQGLKSIEQISEGFLEHASRMLIFLKSVSQVSFSTWEKESIHPHQNYSLHIDSSSSFTRNPFSEKKWKKFQISRLFSSSSSAVKSHVVDVNLHLGEKRILDRWLVVLSMGSGQTRNMALDRRYVAYNLTPVAGVAAHISRNGCPVDVHLPSSIMSPLPLSGSITLPVTVLGCFLVRHNCGRFLFKYQEQGTHPEAHLDARDQLIEAWNKELMCGVRESYIEMVLEMQKLRQEPLNSKIESSAAHSLGHYFKAHGIQLYSFWPRSNEQALLTHADEAYKSEVTTKVLGADWVCLVEQVIKPFYARVADLPLWQLYSGNLVKVEEGMFLAQPGTGEAFNSLPLTVCSFVKEHYPVFSVPWELLAEIQAIGIPFREVRPKMVRALLKSTSAAIVLRSVDSYIDVLEYCLSDIQFQASSNPHEGSVTDEEEKSSSFASTSTNAFPSSSDALEMMTSLGKALFDFGKVVAEDIGRAGGHIVQGNTASASSNARYGDRNRMFLALATELTGLPCPTAINHLARLGVTELWVGNKEQQKLMLPVAAKFIHPKLLERSILANMFSKCSDYALLKLRSWSLQLLASNMKFLFHEHWVNHVMEVKMVPWFSWENTSISSDENGPSLEWIQLFWKNFNGSAEDLSLFSEWPLIPAYLGRPILCRVKEKHLIFFPPPVLEPVSQIGTLDIISMADLDPSSTSVDTNSMAESLKPYASGFELAQSRHPWLFSMLNRCNIPVFDIASLECAKKCCCLPPFNLSLGKVILSKLAAAKHAGYFSELTSIPTSERDELLKLLANDFTSTGSTYETGEMEVLRSLPIFRTATGLYTHLHDRDLCIISANSFLKTYDEHCLSYSSDSDECRLLCALGIPVLHDQQILVRFGLPGFESRPQSEQEDILFYLYSNWKDLQADSTIVEALKEANFVRHSDEFSPDLCKPKDLFDPSDALLTSVFFGERTKFPGERFTSDGWLRILRKTGLRTATETDVILECAKRVEFLGAQQIESGPANDLEEYTQFEKDLPTDLWNLAGSVVEAVFSNFAVLYSNSFCNTLGEIAFVPAELGFPSLGGRNGRKKVLASYREAILSKDWPLAWSCAPVLSRQNVIPPEYSWAAFRLRSPPAFSTVLKHLEVIGRQGGEDTLAHWPNASNFMTVDEAFSEILKYLEKVWGSLSSSDISDLRKMAFLPAANGTRLVGTTSLFVRLPINLSPFAFELPSLYLPYLRILKDLGLRDFLSVGSAMDLLYNLQKACGYQRLNPNELRAVMDILHFLCNNTEEVKVLSNSSMNVDVVVPDDGCRLVHAKSCVYIDRSASCYVKYLDTSHLRFTHPDLPEGICLNLGIRKLSDVVIEELDKAEQIQTLDHIGSVPISSVREKLQSESLHAAIWTLTQCFLTNQNPVVNRMSLEYIQQSLQSAADTLQFVKRVYTRFLLLPRSLDVTIASKVSMIPEWENETRHRTLYFINRPMTCILVGEPPEYLSVYDVVGSVVCQVIGFPTPVPISSLLSCPCGSESAIGSSLSLWSDALLSRSSTNNCLGKEILPQDASQVQIHPLRPYYKGEMVAWKIQQGDKLRFGRVPEDVRPSAGQALYRFMVEIAPGVTELLLSSQVFSFRSISLEGDGPSSSLQELHPTITEDKSSEALETSSSGKDKERPNQQCGHVTSEELVQAVNEMLSAAGIYMDLEKQSLLQRTITLQEQLKESQAALLLEQERVEAAAKEAETAKTQWQCRVCLSNEVDMTLIPCGHVLCRRCSSSVSRCPFCRLQVSKTVRIFRP